MDGAHRRGMARVTRAHGGESIVNLQSNGNSKQQQKQQQRNTLYGRRNSEAAGRSFERSERHRERIAAAAAETTEPVIQKTTNGFGISISAPISTAMGGTLAASAYSDKHFKRRFSQHQPERQQHRASLRAAQCGKEAAHTASANATEASTRGRGGEYGEYICTMSPPVKSVCTFYLLCGGNRLWGR